MRKAGRKGAFLFSSNSLAQKVVFFLLQGVAPFTFFSLGMKGHGKSLVSTTTNFTQKEENIL